MHTIVITVILSLVPTNMELAEDALLLSLDPIPDSLEVYDIENVIVEISGEHSGNWFIQQTVSSVLHESGFNVLERNDGSQSSCAVLRIRPMELVVEYGDVSRPWVVGNKRVERIAKCELSSTLLDPQGAMLMTLRSSGLVEDVIAWSDAEVLNGSDEWAWLSGNLPENRGGGVLEPIIVTGVVASLVYLFYSSRAE